MKRKIIVIIFIGIFFIGFRCIISQIVYYKNGEIFLKKDKSIRAIDAYSLCIKSYVPFSPLNHTCKERIYKIYHSTNDQWEKLYALEMLRSSLISINSVWLQNKKEINDLSVKLAKLKTYIEHGDKEFLEQQIKIHTTDESPNIYLKSLVSIFFIGWLFFTFFYIFKKDFYYLVLSLSSFGVWLYLLKIV